MSISHNANKRVKKLFSDIKSIADQPLAGPASTLSTDANMSMGHVEKLVPQPQTDLLKCQREIEMLNARIHELETLLDKPGTGTESQETDTAPRIAKPVIGLGREAASSAPMLYEKEQVGYVFSNNNLTPIRLVSSTSPEFGNSLTTQLIASGQVIGEMQVHPSAERSITPEDENLASAVAQQVSLQIQNLRLLNAAERARTEALDATRQFTHQSWESFLDGIRNSERIGYSYNQNAVESFMEPSPAQHDYQETVRVLDEQVGRLFIKADPTRPLTDEDRTMINSVAAQIGQQVENIRLLADAARARADAEAAEKTGTPLPNKRKIQRWASSMTRTTLPQLEPHQFHQMVVLNSHWL